MALTQQEKEELYNEFLDRLSQSSVNIEDLDVASRLDEISSLPAYRRGTNELVTIPVEHINEALQSLQLYGNPPYDFGVLTFNEDDSYPTLSAGDENYNKIVNLINASNNGRTVIGQVQLNTSALGGSSKQPVTFQCYYSKQYASIIGTVVIGRAELFLQITGVALPGEDSKIHLNINQVRGTF